MHSPETIGFVRGGQFGLYSLLMITYSPCAKFLLQGEKFLVD